MTDPRPSLLSVRETRQRLGRISDGTIRAMVKDGRLRGFQLAGPGSKLLIDERSVTDFIEARLARQEGKVRAARVARRAKQNNTKQDLRALASAIRKGEA